MYSSPHRHSRWIVLPTLFLLAYSASAADDKDSANADTVPKAAKTVRVEIDYSDGAMKVLKAVPWKPKMTVGDAMAYATAHKRGIKIKARGKGSTAFLEKIDDLQNQGAKGPNWVFRVNGKLGDRSYAITPLKPGDTILWKFDTYP